MRAYKGFKPNPDGTLQCLDKTYKVGETYTEDEAILCETGMHACLAPIDVLAYYSPASSVFHVVEVDDDAQPGAVSDSKVASRTLTVGAELGIAELVAAQVEYTVSRAKPVDGSSTSEYQGAASATGYAGAASATGDWGAASATGYHGAASATGFRGVASATGYRGVASAAGYRGAASATGYQGVASATGVHGAASATGRHSIALAAGDYGAASATGHQGAATATGYQGAASATAEFAIAHADGYGSKARGALGCGLTLAERDDDGTLLELVSVIVGREYDGQTIEPGVWYTLRGGRVVKA